MYGINLDMGLLVDSPGYGKLDFSKRTQNDFKKLLKIYLTESSRLTKVFWCIDTEIGLTDDDRTVFNFMKHAQIPIQLVFTRFDKMYTEDGFRRILAIAQLFKTYDDIFSPHINITSAKTGFGIESLGRAVKQALLEGPTRTVVKKAGKIEYIEEETFTEFEKETFRLLIDDDKYQRQKQLEREIKLLDNQQSE